MIWALSRFHESFGLPVEQNRCDPGHRGFVFFFAELRLRSVFKGGGVDEVSEHEGGEGPWWLLVTSSVYARYNWYNPTLALPRWVSGEALWV